MLVYSCSGSSNVAQLANHLAVRLDRLGLAEMSCIVGVGGDVKPLVHKATRGNPIIAFDGCPLGCVEKVLAAKGIEPDIMIRLHERGLRKVQHTDFDEAEREQIFAEILTELAPRLIAERPELAEPIREALSPAQGVAA